jgi:hypothetical protein
MILGNAWFDLQLEAWILMTDGEASSAVPRPRWQRRNITAVIPLFTQAGVQGSTWQHVLQQDPTPGLGGLLDELLFVDACHSCRGGLLDELLFIDACHSCRYSAIAMTIILR